MTSFILSSAIITFISTALSFFWIVSLWIIFKKAWRKWWESLIPIWNVYLLFKIAGKKLWFWILLLVPILWIVVSLISWFTLRSSDINEYSSIYTIRNMCNRILWLLALILPLMAWITLPYWLTKKFGKSNWFYIGMLFLTPIFFWILAFSDAKYEWVEFDKKYNWKKWILITLGISLVLWCCDAGLKYNQYKDYYSYFDYYNEFDNENDEESYLFGDDDFDDIVEFNENEEETIDISNEIENSSDSEEDQEIRINYNDIKKDDSWYKPTNKKWIDDLAKDYKWNIIMWSDFVDKTKDWLYSVYTEITKRTLYINDEYNFVLKILPEKIGYTMEISYNDISEPATISFKNKSDKLVGEISIYPREDCRYYRGINNWWNYDSFDVMWANEDYFFKADSNYWWIPSWIELITDLMDNYEKIVELKDNYCK